MTHGTRSCYQLAGCRCDPCRSAEAVYHARQYRGLVPGWVDASAARRRLESWQGVDVGLRRAAALTGVSRRTLQAIVSGARPKIAKTTERAILAVDRPSLADGSLVTERASYEARERLRRLLEEEYPIALLIQGLPGGTLRVLATPAAQGTTRARITVLTWKRVQRLYSRLLGHGHEAESN